MARSDKSPDSHDASRREFFRTFSRQTVQGAGTLFGTAEELRRTSVAAARDILGGSSDAAVHPPTTLAETADSPDWTYRSAYRFTGDAIVLLDQRDLPGRVTTISVSEPTEAASAMRAGVVNGGPVLGQVGAYATVLAAARAAERSEAASRQQLMRAAAGTLRGARRDVQALAAAIDRMEARHDELVDLGTDGEGVVAALHAEADALSLSATAASAAIGGRGATLIAAPTSGPIQLLLHGDSGPLTCGMVGMSTALFQSLADAGHSVHAWITEGAPTNEGSRISSRQLAHNDVVHTVIPDSAVAWLFASRSVDAVLLRGDRVCANGDTGGPIGSLGVAQLAAQARVPVYVLAPLAAFDHSAASGQQIRAQITSAAEALAVRRLADDGESREAERPFTLGARLNPPTDIVPAAAIGAIVTEDAVLRAPFAVSISKALAEAVSPVGGA